jgi:hypothetical protein
MRAVNQSNTNECINLAGGIKTGAEWSLINKSNVTEGFRIHQPKGSNNCIDKEGKTTEYKTILKMVCVTTQEVASKKLYVNNTENFVVKDSNCVKEITILSPEACPIANFYQIWDFLTKYNYVFGVGLILLGLFELFLGARLLYVTIFLICGAAGVALIFILVFVFIVPNGVSVAVLWVVFGCSLLLGLVGAYFIARYNKFVIGIVIGAFSGYVLGYLLYNIAFKYIPGNQTLILWLTVGVCMIILAVLSYFLFDHLIIITTSFIGAYAVIRGISFFAGEFPNEAYVIDLYKNEEYDQLKELLSWYVYLYIGCWAIAFGVGVFTQYKLKKDKDEKKKEDDELKKDPLLLTADEKKGKNLKK